MKRVFVLCAVLSMVVGVTFVQAGSSPNGKPFVAINDQIVEVKGVLGTLRDKVDILVGRVDSVEALLAASQGAVDSLIVRNQILDSLVRLNLNSISSIQSEIELIKPVVAGLQADIASNVGDIEVLKDELALNQTLIADLEAAILLSNQNILDINGSLQEQIDDNLSAIKILESDIAQINENLALKQNMISGGTCPDGEAVIAVTESGGVVCGGAGGGNSGQLETVNVWTWQTVPGNSTVSVWSRCDEPPLAGGGYVVMGAGLANAGFFDVLEMHTSKDWAIWNASLVKVRNTSGITSDIASIATCARIAP